MSRLPIAKRPTPPPADEPPEGTLPTSNQPNSVQLGPRDRLIGQLYIEGDLRVGGIVEGELEATGDVEIDDMANVKASLAGRDVTVRGHLVGAVVARKRLVVARSGSVIGDVRVQRLAIQDGANFSGKVSMGAAAEASAKPIEAKAVAPEPEPVPEVQAVVEAPRAPIPSPVIPTPITPTPAAPVRSDGKDGKAKAMPPKAAPPKAAAHKPPAARATPPKAPPPKGKPKRR